MTGRTEAALFAMRHGLVERDRAYQEVRQEHRSADRFGLIGPINQYNGRMTSTTSTQTDHPDH